MKKALIPLTLVLAVQLAACSVNQVTGERNFQIYGAEWEQEVGAQMYAPMKQSQGGEFILDPKLTDYITEVGQRLADQARRKEQLNFEFAILNDSSPNAWALPGGKIVINRGLLSELGSEAELAAVLGHEIVHADAAHGARAQSKGMLTQVGAVATMIILGSTVDSQATREIAMIVPAMGAQLLTQKYGRDAERESDEYGMLYMSEAGYDPRGAVQLQETFLQLAEGRNQDWLSGLFASHPPSRERLENNRETASALPAGGENGQERFMARTAYLRRVNPAYKAFDEANKAASEKNLELAQLKLDEAMAIEPRESLFHALQGDILALNQNPDRALTSYHRAIDSNPGFFYAYLRKGQMEFNQEQFDSARSDLSSSLELMPTAEAHYLLGMMDKSAGRMNEAMAHFQAAAQSESESGQRANRELILMDLSRNPSKYIASRAVIDNDNDNTIWVQLTNQTSVPMENIEISYAWLDEQGQTRQGKKSYRGPLGSGQQDRVRLSIKLDNPGELGRRVRVEVSAASAAE